MDLDRQAALLQSKDGGGLLIEDLVDDVHVTEVVAGSQRSDLLATARLGAVRYLGGVRVLDSAAFLRPPDVVLGGVAIPLRPTPALAPAMVDVWQRDVDGA